MLIKHIFFAIISNGTKISQVNLIKMPINKINLKILNFAIVIVGTGFSPNNFNGDMLAEKEIVPLDWKVLNNVSSPIFSQIVYEKGKVNIRVEKNKITIADNFITDNKIENSKIAQVAKKLIQKHKHLSYTALGINFETVVPIEKTENYLKENFINPDKYGVGDNTVGQVSITMMYQLKGGGMLNVVLDEGILGYKFEENAVEYKGILCNANFHRQCQNDSDLPLLISRLNNSNLLEDKQKLASVLSGLIK